MSSGFNGVAQGFLGGAGGGSGLPTGGVEGDVLTLDENLNAVWASVTPPLSPEVQVAIAYSNLVGLDSTQKQAAVALANAQVLGGYRNKIVALYVFKAGATLSQKTYNFVDPSNYGKAVAQAVPANGNVTPVANALGIELGNNWSSEIVMPYPPTDIVGCPNIGMGIVQPFAKDMQFYNNDSKLSILIDVNDIYCALGCITAGAIVGGGVANRLKPYWQRTGETVEFYNAGVKISTVTKAFDSLSSNPIFYFLRNNGTAETVSAMYLTKAMTESEVSQFSTDLDTFLNSL